MDIKAFNTMVGRNIRFLREERGLSVEDLAKLSQGLSRPLITKIENNRTEDNKHKKQIALEHIEMLANALKVPVDVILENNERLNALFQSYEEALKDWKIDDSLHQAVNQFIIQMSSRGPREQIRALNIAGGIDYKRGLIEAAIKCYQLALKVAMQSIDYEMIFMTRYHLASAYFVIGEYEKLTQIIQRNLEETADCKQRGKSLYLLGLSYTAQRIWDKAIDALLIAIEEIREAQQKVFEGRCYHTLGELFKNTRQYEKSKKSIENALLISRETGDDIGEIYSLKTYGEVCLEQGNQQGAIESFSIALQKAQLTGTFRKMEIVKLEFYIALCNKELERMVEFLSEIEQFEIAPSDLSEMYKETARVASFHKRYQEAIEYYEKAIQKLEK